MARLEANIPGRGIRIHQIANPEVGVWAGGDSISTSNASKGSVRHYAGGHRRAITWNAIDRTSTVNLPLDTVEQVNIIESWIDSTVLLRSVRGEVLAGLLNSVRTSARTSMNVGYIGCNISLMLTTEDGSA